MKQVMFFALFLLLNTTHHGLAAGGGGSDDNTASSSYSAAPKHPELKAARHAITRKQFTVAIDELRAVLDKQPEHADAWNLLGYSARKSGDFKTAEAAYTKALEIDPKHTQAMEYMGEMYLTLNQPEKAEQLLNRLNKLCSFNCIDRDALKLAIKTYKAAQS